MAFLGPRLSSSRTSLLLKKSSEVWLTFSDPQPKDEKGTKRITSEVFSSGTSSLWCPVVTSTSKATATCLYALSKEGWIEAGFPILEDSQDVYGDLVRVDADFAEVLHIRTYYESRWLEEGKKIHYLRTRA